MQFIIPPSLTKKHEQALTAYLTDRRKLTTAVWQNLYEAIDILDEAQVIIGHSKQTFRQLYDVYVAQPFASPYIDQLLTTKDVAKEGSMLAAVFARQIGPSLQKADLVRRDTPQSWLLLVYCLYWWQSFARGYSFEVEIMRDLTSSGIQFQMHDIRHRSERYSPADLIVSNLMGDIKTSIYFLQQQVRGELSNDFYITRLFDKGHERILVVFQKPFAWEFIGGGTAVPSTLENVLSLLPRPVQIAQHGIILVVIDYESWKQLVRRKQAGAEHV
ncbi:MAG TPA: hypothetical protein PLD25_32025 [Chloroflexota bacterium]|nr:hypothetical protein [Chloroflexota bacterium]